MGSAEGNWFLQGTIGYSGRLVDEVKNATSPLPGGMVAGKNEYSWSHRALTPHWVYPSVWMASLGTFRDPAGDFPQLAIHRGPITPDKLTAADGIAVYELSNWSMVGPNDEMIDYTNLPVGYHVKINDAVEGLLAVRVNADNTLTVERRPDLAKAADFSVFSSEAETYWR